MYEKITYRRRKNFVIFSNRILMVIMKSNLLTSDAPPEAVEAFEKWKELSLRLDKEAEALFFETEVIEDEN